MVAPDVPVPDRRKTARASSAKKMRMPWLRVTDWSTGSV
jgi:hypothetical protein